MSTITAPASPEPPVLITEKEAARLLLCCERTVWKLRSEGKLRCVKLGTAIRYTRTEIDRFIECQMNQNDSNPETN